MKRRYAALGMSSVLAIALAVPAFGGPSNPVATGAASAKKTAKKALAAATAAQSTATSAQSTANGAQTTASGAQATANQALTAAQAAQTTATNALNAANSKLAGTNPSVVGPGSGSGSGASQTDTASCPAQFEITGGGFFTGGDGSNDVTPQFNAAYGDAWIATIEEIGGGTAENHAVTATAVCVN